MNYHSIQTMIITLSIVALLLILLRLAFVLKQRSKKGLPYGCHLSIGSRDIQTDCGCVLEHDDGLIGILVDGRGRYRRGVTASTMTLETIQDAIEMEHPFHNPRYFFQKSMRMANNRVLDQLDDGFAEVSVSIAMIKHRTLYYAGVGNVRIYVLREKQLIPVTEGHTVDVLAKKNYQHGNLTKQTTIALLQEHRLYNYIGQDGFCEVELFDQEVPLHKGDLVVILTDGVYDTIPYDTLEMILQQKGDCAHIAEEIIYCFTQVPEEKDNAGVVVMAV